MIYNRKPQTIEAFTFDEVVQAGLQAGATMVSGMPGKFMFRDVTLAYQAELRIYLAGFGGVPFGPLHPDDMLLIFEGAPHVVAAEAFVMVYEPALSPIPEAAPLDFAAGEIRATGTTGAADGPQ